jgi:anthranilate/para-aminobenzoate synthase component I
VKRLSEFSADENHLFEVQGWPRRCARNRRDLLTPVSAFLKVAEHADYAFLLESVEGGEHVGRYSFLGKDPFLSCTARGGDHRRRGCRAKSR